MLKEFKNHLDNNLSFLKNKKILIASSGGLDSTVLTYLLHTLNYTTEVAHCNFKLRGKDSDLDETFVKNWGSFLNLKVYSKKFETKKYAAEQKLSIQMAARELRYNWFADILKKKSIDCIVTAHHQDDVLETFLINLTRGTGLDGLTGIPEINGNVVRPLLPFSRDQIATFAKENNITWREDKSNASTKYLRNKIRHEIVPIFKELNANFLSSFEKTLTNLNESKVLADSQAKKFENTVVEKLEKNIYRLDTNILLETNNLKANLYPFLKKFGFTNWHDIFQILKAQSGKQLFSKTHKILKNRSEILLSEITTSDCNTYPITENFSNLKKPIGLNFVSCNTANKITKNTIYLDKDKITQPLFVRKWKKGDYFYPIGMNGKKKLSKYFKDEKMSLLEKENCWVLCNGETIVWVIGRRMDNRFKPTESCNNILEVNFVNS